MKIDPINFVIEDKLIVEKNIYFVSGNEITLMEKIKEIIISNIKTSAVEKIKNVSLIRNDLSLFDSKKIYVISELASVDESCLDELSSKNDVFIFFYQNSPKIRKIKNIFGKRSDCILFDCYELNKETKSKVINKYLNNLNLSLEEEAYWKLVDRLDDKFMLLEKELLKLSSLKNNQINEKTIDELISNNSSKIEKIFFQLLNDNEYIIKQYKAKITNDSDVSELYYIFKRYSLLFLSSGNQIEFENNIPLYLFKEKNYLVGLYKKFNFRKKRVLLNLLYKTERALRKSGELSFVLGLQFLLSFKKIIIS